MMSVPWWRNFRRRLGAYRAKLRFCLRVTIAGLIAFAFAQAFNLPLHGLWVVLTAVVVSQMSAGGSLRATTEYVVGTLGGALYAGLIGAFVPHTTSLELAGLLALTIAPLALAAAINLNFRVAPFSAVLVLLIAGQLGEGPVASAATRFVEVALGGAIAVAVSLLVFPERAHRMGVVAAARVLKQMARVLTELLDGFAGQLDAAAVRHLQDEIGEGVGSIQALAAEAESERVLRFAAGPDQGPLARTLLRIRHDLVILGRAAATPLPETMGRRLGPLLRRLSANGGEFLLGCATALMLHRKPPSLQGAQAALNAFTSEFSLLRREGLTRSLSDSEVEQVFALGFALDQLYRNFSDLERCVAEYGRAGSAA